jgi:uncharacterized SAM-binding protein YcdF (DUF218 family)
MIYCVSKFFWIVAGPTNVLILITVAGAFWGFTRKSKRAVLLATSSACGLAIGGFTPVGLWAMEPLESRFPAWDSNSRTIPHGIILLGGDNGEGIIVLAELSQQFPQTRLLYSGPGRSITKADESLENFAHFGGDPTRIIMETRSRTTFENAIYSAELMKPKSNERWLLITAALHMPRSVGSFRHAGFSIEAYPIPFTTEGEPDSIFEGSAISKSLSQLDAPAKEWIGLVVYRVLGRTDALFPGP